MLYKPTSPSPYAQCVVLDETEGDIKQFSCSMIGGTDIETAKLRLSDGDLQYHFVPTVAVKHYKKIDYRIIEKFDTNNEAYYYAVRGGLTYIYPVISGKEYTIQCEKNRVFRVCYHETYKALGTNYRLTGVCIDDTINEYTYTATSDGYIYVNVSDINSSANGQIIVSVVENLTESNQILLNINKEDGNSNIAFLTNIAGSYSGYMIKFADSSRNKFTEISLNDVLKKDKNCTWQARLYEKGSLDDDNHRGGTWLGYGVVEEASTFSEYRNEYNYWYLDKSTYTLSSSPTESGGSRICFKVRPHTNIYFPNSTNNVTTLSDFNIQHLFNYYDDDARYYIKINGGYYRIRDYRFYSPSTSSSNSMRTYDIDSYGEPRYGYIVIDYKNDENEPQVNVGDQYEIYCNYIDSDEFYFNIVDKPTLTLFDAYDDTEINGTEEKSTRIGRSNFALNGVYSHTSGAYIEKYNIILYKNESTDAESKNWVIIDQPETIYSSSITYNYDMLMNGNEYKISIVTCDSLGYTIKKDVYIECEYGFYVPEFAVDAKYYNKHDSIVISWNVINSEDKIDSIHHFEVYKKIGNNTKLHKVYSTLNNKECIIEDFAVGNLCDYTYFVYPVSEVYDNGDTRLLAEAVSSPTVKHNYGATTIFGLVQDEEDLNTYTIDYNEMWRFEFNLENSGTTLNMDKTFIDSQNRFPKMMGGNRKYNTITVKGLIGYYDCEKDDYVENYDLLEGWEDFATNNKLKLLKDRHGRLVPCDIESSSFEYMDVIEAPATVSFSVKQLESMDNITILGRALIHNPVTSAILTDSNGAILVDSSEYVLTSQEG